MKGTKRKKHFRLSSMFFLLFTISLFFFILGLFLFVTKDVPDVKTLKSLKDKPVSVVYGINDEPIYLILPEKRITVPYNSIPSYVKDAFLAAEDADFFKHGPLDFMSIMRAIWINLKYGRILQGGSTITQQVIKTMVLGPERSFVRKIKEAILAYRLERNLSKKEIFNLYLNVVYMGHGVSGVEAAAELYFGKHVYELTRAEAALLAGIVQAPARYSPKKHPGLARLRQEYVIEQMSKKGFINEKQKKAMLKEKIRIRMDDGLFKEDYFKDYIVRYVEEKYGKGIFLKRALKIYATVDPQLQIWAEEALKKGLSRYEQRRGEYRAQGHLKRDMWHEFREVREKDLAFSGLAKGETYELLVSERLKNGYKVYLGKREGILEIENFPFKAGDIVKGIYEGQWKGAHYFKALKSNNVEGAIVSIDVNSGYVLAMAGGRDFKESPFNRVFSSKIQPGSAFKPFVYLAALTKGYNLDSTVLDEPKTYPGGPWGSWVPKNYDGRYDGEINIKDAIAYSKNAATVRLLEDIGMESLIKTIEEMGMDAKVPYNLTAALGTLNLSLFELTKGFTVFANDGYRIKPIFIRRIEDERGNIIEVNECQKTRVLDENVAHMMNVLLRAPVEYGTARAASRLPWFAAGKTGTTDNYFDALFVGYSKSLCTGVWVGFDERKSLGENESGARVALPIWMDFMARAVAKYPPTESIDHLPIQNLSNISFITSSFAVSPVSSER